jgi:tetratricopeptide (TPR) repeat protein
MLAPFVLSLATAAAAALPPASPSRAPVTGKDVEQAFLDGSTAALQGYRQELRGRLRTSTAPADRYLLAFVNWRLNQLLHATRDTEDQRDAALTEAQEQLERLVAESPSAESWALLGGVLGERIGIQPFRGMTLGSRASAALARASELAADNPRVLLQQGVSHFFTPSMFGGSLEKAEDELRRARARFAAQPADAPWPNWGRVDAMAWLGQLLAKKGQVADARAVYEQALEMEPRSNWIRYVLLPALDRSR